MDRDQSIRLMQDLLRRMVEKKGSDLFITAGFPPAIRNLIREGKIAQMYSAIQTGGAQGMQTLDQCLQDMVQKGVVSREEAKYKAQNKDSI